MVGQLTMVFQPIIMCMSFYLMHMGYFGKLVKLNVYGLGLNRKVRAIIKNSLMKLFKCLLMKPFGGVMVAG